MAIEASSASLTESSRAGVPKPGHTEPRSSDPPPAGAPVFAKALHRARVDALRISSDVVLSVGVGVVRPDERAKAGYFAAWYQVGQEDLPAAA